MSADRWLAKAFGDVSVDGDARASRESRGGRARDEVRRGRFKRSLAPRRAVCLIFPLSFERARGGEWTVDRSVTARERGETRGCRCSGSIERVRREARGD